MKLMIAIAALSLGSSASASSSRHYLELAESRQECAQFCQEAYGPWYQDVSEDFISSTNECFCWISDGGGDGGSGE